LNKQEEIAKLIIDCGTRIDLDQCLLQVKLAKAPGILNHLAQDRVVVSEKNWV
jgi:hypothetical protein